MIEISATASAEIRRLRSKQMSSPVFFRFEVKSGGCLGWFYAMSFEEDVKEGDRVYDCSGIQLLVDARSSEHINGLKLDYSEDLMGGGFRFHNPKAISQCGCGNSFAIESSSL